MDSVVNWLIDPSGLTPHGFCLLWQPGLLWTHAIADTLIALAYFTIPVALAVFVQRRRDLTFRPVFLLFAAFILLCGAGHVLDVVTLWLPAYGISAVVKLATAAASLTTAAVVWRLMPAAMALPAPAALRAALHELSLREAQQRASFVGAPMALHVLDASGLIIEVSDRWLQMLGYTREAVIGRDVSAFIIDGPTLASGMGGALTTGEEVRDGAGHARCRDGTVLDVLISTRVEPVQPPPAAEPTTDTIRLLGAVVDVTARTRAEAALRRSEEQLQQSQKLEAVGQLSGGIAHDFNNYLQAVIGSLELIQRRADRPDEVLRLVDQGLEVSEKAGQLTHQMLSFARRQRLESCRLDPCEVIAGMTALLGRSLGSGITLHVELAQDVGLCMADRSQLESALLNLVINARDAMTGLGEVWLRAGPMHVRADMDMAVGEGDYVRLSVADNGPGMEPEVRARAFEPFFTTKPPGLGTGLGLAQLHGFAHQSGGTAWIDSTPGQGTEVVILLPAATAEAPGPELSEPDSTGLDTSGTDVRARDGSRPVDGRPCLLVLVVDDDATVRAAVADLLRDQGHAVLQAGDADQALAIMSEVAELQAVITDLSMPGSMDGAALARVVRQHYPRTGILLMTGCADALDASNLPPEIGCVEKPATAEQLLTALRQVTTRALVGA